MSAILNPYLYFRGHARQAMEFYHSVFGGELSVLTFGEMGDPYPGEGDAVMHAQLETPSGFTLMASDVPARLPYDPGRNAHSVSISGAHADGDELRDYWSKLAAAGEVTQPLDMAVWGGTFGMLNDRFGVNWLVSISAE